MATAAVTDWPSRAYLVQRARRRASVSLPVLVETPTGKYSAHIRDLSPGGAMVETSGPLKYGMIVTLNCGAIQAEGAVAWADSGRFGIEFHTPVDEAEVARQVIRSEAAALRRKERLSLVDPA